MMVCDLHDDPVQHENDEPCPVCEFGPIYPRVFHGIYGCGHVHSFPGITPDGCSYCQGTE